MNPQVQSRFVRALEAEYDARVAAAVAAGADAEAAHRSAFEHVRQIGYAALAALNTRRPDPPRPRRWAIPPEAGGPARLFTYTRGARAVPCLPPKRQAGRPVLPSPERKES